MEIDARFPPPETGHSAPGRAAGTGTGTLQVDPAATASAFFISPVLRFDSRSLTVIFQVRDSRSGDVIRQFPPETVVARYQQDPSARPFLQPEEAQGATEAGTTGQRGETGVGEAAPGEREEPQPPPVDLVA